MKMLKYEYKVAPVNSEVLVDLNNIENPGYVHCRIQNLLTCKYFLRDLLLAVICITLHVFLS